MKFFKRDEPAPAPVAEAAEPPDSPVRTGLLSRLRAGLGKTRSAMSEGLASLFLGRKTLDDDLLEELETRLLLADVGVKTTREVLDALTRRVKHRELGDADALYRALKEELLAVLAPSTRPLKVPRNGKPFVILLVGVNGAGKTTTIGKLARRMQGDGLSVMLAAGDTFRAAAVEQLQTWGVRNNVPVIAQQTGSDSASVIFDALQAAQARGVDVLLADTAGRLHVKANLMEELRKIVRVMVSRRHAVSASPWPSRASPSPSLTVPPRVGSCLPLPASLACLSAISGSVNPSKTFVPLTPPNL